MTPTVSCRCSPVSALPPSPWCPDGVCLRRVDFCTSSTFLLLCRPFPRLPAHPDRALANSDTAAHTSPSLSLPSSPAMGVPKFYKWVSPSLERIQ